MKWTNKGHQYDKLGSFLKGLKKIFIYGTGLDWRYGAGEEGQRFLEKLNWMGIAQDFDIVFVDSDVSMHGTIVCEKLVISPEQFADVFNNHSAESIVIICSQLRTDAERILNDISRCSEVKLNYNCFTTCRDSYRETMVDKLFLPVLMIYKYDKLYMGYVCQIPTSRCTLKCKDCLNFITYFKQPQDDTFESIKSDVDLYFSKVDFAFKHVLNGGEILLMPNLPEILDYIGGNYGKRIFELVLITNGTIVPSDALISSLVRNNVVVQLDDYTETISWVKRVYKDVVKKFSDGKVNFSESRMRTWFDLKIRDKDYVLTDEKSVTARAAACNLPYRHLRNGRIAFCDWQSFAVDAEVEKFAEGDYIEVANATKAELMEFDTGYTQKGYVEMCKHCAGNITINDNVIPAALQVGSEELLMEFCRKHKKIYIYGTGNLAIHYYNALSGSVDNIEGFVVSDFHKKYALLKNKYVYELSEIAPDSETGIIFAVNAQDAQKVILEELKRREFANVYSEVAQHLL